MVTAVSVGAVIAPAAMVVVAGAVVSTTIMLVAADGGGAVVVAAETRGCLLHHRWSLRWLLVLVRWLIQEG